MRYIQCLIQNKKYYQLRWLPEKFANVDSLLKIKGLWGDSWLVKEVYTNGEECIKESGKCIWDVAVNPYLEGELLRDRLSMYKKSIRIEQIEEI